MEHNISFSSDTDDFEGFTQADRVQGHSIPRSPELALQPLVPSPQANDAVIHSPAVSPTLPASEENQMFRFLLSEPRPTRLDFLRRCYAKRYSDSVVKLIVQKLQGSSQNRYEST